MAAAESPREAAGLAPFPHRRAQRAGLGSAGAGQGGRLSRQGIQTSPIQAHAGTERPLCFHNFEWLANSAHSLGYRSPRVENRVVKIPIMFDDFGMYRHGIPYDEWEQKALQSVRENPFVAFSLHDCYADFWLPRYESFLGKLAGIGTFRTLDEVSSRTLLAAAA
jgi:hypothetical protein